MGDGKWHFWIDRGGTFTDVVARSPQGQITTHKLLSENPEHYQDAVLQGIRDVLGLGSSDPLPHAQIASIKMGTTVATNALLERRGEPTVWVTTRGFGDMLRIGYQQRPNLFARNIILPLPVHDRVIEVTERVMANGPVDIALDEAEAERDLKAAYDAGIRSAAITFMHGYRYPAHEQRVAEIARNIGFPQVSVSHEVSPLIKFISRGDTTVVDAYLSPILRRYVDTVAADVLSEQSQTRLMFMQSNGGLTDASLFQGKDSILSGPAGGVVGAARTSLMAGLEKVIAFDMGGTSTDVSHFAGELERSFETEVAGVRIRAPMLYIHTVAAGGGSILHFDGARYRVGPDSAGANPGPACYRRGGPLTVTDCNVMLGRIGPRFFPDVFGPGQDEPLDDQVVAEKFATLAAEITAATGDQRTPQAVAEGFLTIAVENMANAIKKISLQRGYDVSEYALCCFGGAGGQHACRIADSLGMRTVFIHPHAGVLSAYGMGLADIVAMRERSIEAHLEDEVMDDLTDVIGALETEAVAELRGQIGTDSPVTIERRVLVRYDGTDSALTVDFSTKADITAAFEDLHRQRYGFIAPDKPLILEAAVVEALGGAADADEPETGDESLGRSGESVPRVAEAPVFLSGEHRDVPVIDRNEMIPGDMIEGPAIVVEPHGTNVVEEGWQARLTSRGHLILERTLSEGSTVQLRTDADPVMLEVFNNMFMSIAEQMGTALTKTAYSVNIKERWDFSCAIFDPDGQLVANAPHQPVHLGSMGESIAAVIRSRRDSMRPGEVYMLNAPYNGGTHLPDVTVVRPVFDDTGRQVIFYVGARAHHADIGGLTPGSVPPNSQVVEEEGVLIDDFLVVENGVLREHESRALFASGKYPSRNVDQNMADLTAQIAACEKGVQELEKMVRHYGLDVVQAYMGHVQDNAEQLVRQVLGVLEGGSFAYAMDNGAEIRVRIDVDHEAQRATVDFTGTAPQQPNNFNAPTAVCKAAVLYVFRTLIDDDIPLNEGCLKPLNIIVPEGCMLAPRYPAAVVAGNVETSQYVTDTLYGALGTMAASQGTMNNVTFGDETWQYYETNAGGGGAGPDFDGVSVVQTHMTNGRLADPEVHEWRFPVLIECLRVRKGSGGKGRHVGGDGSHRRLRFLRSMTAAIVSGHRKVPPYGMAGGEPGEVGRTWVERTDGSNVVLEACDQIEMKAGDVFVLNTPSGGGYGPPGERE